MWVAFGLGNLISNMPTGDPVWGEATRDGLVLDVEVLRGAGTPTIGALIAHPVWVDQAAGWVVRDVAAARRDPALAALFGPLNESWARTAAVVGSDVLPAA
jgi:hypothetical protein